MARDLLTADERGLRQALDADPSDALVRLAFADWLEEAGRDREAACQRWMVREGHVPHPARRPADRGVWRWYNIESFKTSSYRDRPEMLAESLYLRLPRTSSSNTAQSYSTRGDAEAALCAALAAARAVA